MLRNSYNLILKYDKPAERQGDILVSGKGSEAHGVVELEARRSFLYI